VVEISDRLALDHATPPKLTFTTNNKVLATALKAAGINSESYVISGPRMFPTPKVRRYAYVIRPELIAQWKTELITQGAPPMTGSGYFDFLNRMYAPLEK
jgi:hypothetical protein